MGRVSWQDIYDYPDEELVRWLYIPSTNTVATAPFADKTHYQIFYDQGYQALDRKNIEWWGGYYVPLTGQLHISHYPEDHGDVAATVDEDQVEHAVRNYFDSVRTSSIDDGSCPVCRHELDTDAGGYAYCSNCGWFPTDDTIPGETQNSEDYLHERDFPDYLNDPGFPTYLQHVARIWNVQVVKNLGFGGTTGPGATGRPFITDGENLWVGENSSAHEALLYAIKNQDERERATDVYESHVHGGVHNPDYGNGASGYFVNGKAKGILGSYDLAQQAVPTLIQLFGDDDSGEGMHWINAKTSHIELLDDVFKPHSNDDETRRTFIYLAPVDTLYLARNNAYHHDIEYWLYQHRPDDWRSLYGTKGYIDNEKDIALGFIERNWEDHALEARMYYAEGMDNLPDHIINELSNEFGEKVYVRDWEYPVAMDPFDRYDPQPEYEEEPTQQYPSGWSRDEGIIASFLKIAADVRQLAQRAYDQIHARQDVAKIFELADVWDKEYLQKQDSLHGSNFGKIFPDAPQKDPTTDAEARRFRQTQNAHVLANQIQYALINMLNNYPASYKLMSNAVKTLKTWAHEAENQSGEGQNVQWNRDPGRHVGDIYGQAGTLLTKLRQENRTPEGMDVNQMNFGQVQDWLYEYQESQRNENGGYLTNDVVYDLGNGWHIVRINNNEDLRTEGELMGHCVGGYCDNVRMGYSLIYSLRDPKNSPHATIEIRGQGLHVNPLAPANEGYNEDQATVPPEEDWEVAQIQGKKNEEPIPEYQAMIKQWFEYLQDEQGVHFAPYLMSNLVEYVQDADELMSWYEAHANDPEPTNTERDAYGLPKSNPDENEFEFQWSTLIDYCLDSLRYNDRRNWSYQSHYSPQELVAALTVAANRYKLPLQDREKYIEGGWQELQEDEEKIDDLNLDYYHDVAQAGWEFHHPDEAMDAAHDDYLQYHDEARNELMNELFGDQYDFMSRLQSAWIGNQVQTKVIYV